MSTSKTRVGLFFAFLAWNNTSQWTC